MKRLTYLLLLSALCLAASCNKDDDQPCIGCYDEIVRCKVNGLDWEAFDYTEGELFGWGTGATDLQYYSDTKSLTLRAGRKLEDQSVDQGFNIKIKPASVGENFIIYRGNEFGDNLRPGNCGYYDLDTFNIRQIIILDIDTINQIIKGQFEFSAIDRYENCNDTVHITEGYFDIKYRF